jgi:hypothetical protein
LGYLLFWHFQEGILTTLCCLQFAHWYPAQPSASATGGIYALATHFHNARLVHTSSARMESQRIVYLSPMPVDQMGVK